MENQIDTYILAREVARERTTVKREQVVLEYPGAWLRSFASTVRNLINTVERLFKTPLEQAAFCTYHPAECGGIA